MYRLSKLPSSALFCPDFLKSESNIYVQIRYNETVAIATWSRDYCYLQYADDSDVGGVFSDAEHIFINQD